MERPTIIDFVEKYSRKFADHTYLREKVDGVWTETTFKQTRDEGRILAAGFMALGLAKGERVSLLSEARNLWVMTELGILYAGGVNVPLSYKLESDTDLSFRINHSDSVFAVASENELPKIRRIIGQCPAVRKVIVLDDVPLQEGEMFIGELRSMGVAYLKEHSAELEARIATIGPDDYANISYTSGTTADPKGILLTHRNYTANVEQGSSVISVPEGSTMLIILPLDHCFAHVAGFYTMMMYGGSIATVPVGKTQLATLRNIPGAIKDTKPYVMLSVPALSRTFKKSIESAVRAQGEKVEKLFNWGVNLAIGYNREYYNAGKPWIKHFWKKPILNFFDKKVFSTIREKAFGPNMHFFVGGGALLDIELQRWYNAIGVPVFQGYGLSEATPIICANSAGHAIFGSSGRTVEPMDIKICDEDHNEVPDGVTGEIVIRGENVMAGYWKNPEATAKTVVDGWLYTGDRGYLYPKDRRYLYVTGRFKSLLIAADGDKYSPEGYEDNLTSVSPFVEQAIIHNNQNPYTILLVVPNKELLRSWLAKEHPGVDAGSEDGRKAMLLKLQSEVDTYRKGGKHEGMFPEKWLPAAIVVCPEAWTEQNGLVNSTAKIVRGKVEKRFQGLIDYAYTPEGKALLNSKNMQAI